MTTTRLHGVTSIHPRGADPDVSRRLITPR